MRSHVLQALTTKLREAETALKEQSDEFNMISAKQSKEIQDLREQLMNDVAIRDLEIAKVYTLDCVSQLSECVDSYEVCSRMHRIALRRQTSG